MPLRVHLKRVFRRSKEKGQDSLPASRDESPETEPAGQNEDPQSHGSSNTLHASASKVEMNGLWEEAYNKLKEKDAKLIDFYETDVLASGSLEPGADRQTQLQKLVENKLQTLHYTRFNVTLGKKIVVRDQVRKVAQMIVSVKDFISAAVTAEPHASLAWAGVFVILPVLLNPITQDDDAVQGLEYISDLLIRCRVVECTHLEIYETVGQRSRAELQKLCASIRAKTVELYVEILHYQIRLAKQYSNTKMFRLLRDLAATDDWKGILANIKVLEQTMKQGLETLGDNTIKSIDTTVSYLRDKMTASLNLLEQTRDVVTESEQARLLKSLPYSEEAGFNSLDDQNKPQCLRGTQLKILAQIQSWSEDPAEKPIFWLKGMAGTGKSTISRTVAAAFHDASYLIVQKPIAEEIRLGGSFFFNHAKPDRNNAKRLFTTLARHLTELLLEIRPFLSEAISQRPDIADQSLSNQWNHLILRPLCKLEEIMKWPRTLVFVIDALDECEAEGDLEIVVQLLSQFTELKTLHIRVFITSRPEIDIRTAFQQVPEAFLHDEILSKVLTMDTENNFKDDITLLLEHELLKTSMKHLLEQWPGEDRVKMLASKSDGLFIYAATVCRFLGESRLSKGMIERRLNMILQGSNAKISLHKSLDDMYIRILQFCAIEGKFDEEEEKELLKNFKHIVGSIVCLLDPLSSQTLSELLLISRLEIDDTLRGLYSVVDVPPREDLPIQLLHLSFRDFLLDENRCEERFRVNEAVSQSILFRSCLKTMSSTLKRDICYLKKPGVLNTEVEKSRVAEHIPPHVQYACRYWISHLLNGRSDDDMAEAEAFLNVHFLHWLEAMSLIEAMSDAVNSVTKLFQHLSGLQPHSNEELHDFIYDARRFVLYFRSIIAEAPLQVYCSALCFAPENSIIRSKFQFETPLWIHRASEVQKQWSPLLQVFERHRDPISSIKFSSDGKVLASSSSECIITIWECGTGALLHTLEGYSESAESLAFSSKSRRLVSGHKDGTVRVWDTFLGILLQTFIGHNDKVSIVNLCTDESLVATASDDQTIKIWDAMAAAVMQTFKGENCKDLIFSSETQQLISVHQGSGVKFWDIESGTLLRSVGLCKKEYSAISFSPNSGLVTYGHEYHNTHDAIGIETWDSTTGSFLYRSKTGAIYGLASQDGRFVISAEDGVIRQWDKVTGELFHQYTDQPMLHSAVAISPDGNLIASGTKNGRVMLWETVKTPGLETVKKRYYNYWKISLSPDGRLFASLSLLILSSQSWKIVGLWDPSNGKLLHTLVNSCHVRGETAVFSLTGDTFAFVSDEGDINLWNTATGVVSHTLKGYDRQSVSFSAPCLAFSPNGKVVTAAYQEKVLLWSCATGELLQVFSGHQDRIKNVLFSPNSKVIASTSRDGTAFLWDSISGLVLHEFKHDSKSSFDGIIAFSPDSKLLAFNSHEFTVQVYDVTTAELLYTYSDHSTWMRDLIFLPNGKLVLSASDNEVRLWDPITGQLHGNADIGPNTFTNITFSEDGQYLNTSKGRLAVSSFLYGKPDSKGQILVNHDWVYTQMERVLWLPNEYRAKRAAVQGNTLIMVHRSGDVSCIKFGDVEHVL